ncbi:MAG: hypothetical protein ABJQ98_17070 [Alloalcanivorax venustensis]|jgi:hypothetical protein|uniref:hypothetical protein n=1 Tax=Alloalcanivorax venustensis TaxID=172371 RepID=UPI00329A7804
MIRVAVLWSICFLSSFVAASGEFDFSTVQNLAISVAFASASVWVFIHGRYLVFIRANSESKDEGLFGKLILPAMAVYLFAFPVAGLDFFSWFYIALMVAAVVVVWDPGMGLTRKLWMHRFHEFREFPDDGSVGQESIRKYKAIVYICAFVFPIAAILMKSAY